MEIELRDRSEDHVRLYFQRSGDPEICEMLPRTVTTLEQALENYRRSLLPGATSYGRTVYADGIYVGDVWCYCINPEEDPQAMVSYCIFDKTVWNRGIMSRALALFLDEVESRFCLTAIGAFTYASNKASIRVLEKCGFVKMEDFVEQDVLSSYYQRGGSV